MSYQSNKPHLSLEDLNTTIALKLVRGVYLTYQQTIAAIETYFKDVPDGLRYTKDVIKERIERANKTRDAGHSFVMRSSGGVCDLYDDTVGHPTFDPINDIYADDAVALLREIGVQI